MTSPAVAAPKSNRHLARTSRDQYCFVSHRLAFALTLAHPQDEFHERTGKKRVLPGLHVLFEEMGLYDKQVGFVDVLAIDVVKNGHYHADAVVDMLLEHPECGSIEEGTTCEFEHYPLWKEERELEAQTQQRIKKMRAVADAEREKRRMKGGVDTFIFASPDGAPGEKFSDDLTRSKRHAMTGHLTGLVPEDDEEEETGGLTAEQQAEVAAALQAHAAGAGDADEPDDVDADSEGDEEEGEDEQQDEKQRKPGPPKPVVSARARKSAKKSAKKKASRK